MPLPTINDKSFWSPDSRNFFIFCLASGILLRAYIAVFSDFWLDELWSSGFSNPSHTLKDVIKKTLADVHPPLYQILLYFWFSVFGFTEIVSRSLSLLCGIIAIPCFYHLAQSVCGSRVAKVACIIFALNPFAAFYAAETRSYELLLLLSITSTYFFSAYIRHQNPLNLAGYFLCSLAAIYTHYFGFILLLTHGISWIFLLSKTKDRRLFFHIGIVFALLLLAYLPMLDAVKSHAGKSWFWIKNPNLLELAAYPFIYFGGPLALPLFIIAAVIRFKNKPFLFWEYLAVLSVILIYLVPYFTGFVIKPLLTPRNTIIAIPYLILLLAYPIHKAAAIIRLIFFAICMVIAILALILVPPYKGEDIDSVLTAIDESGLPVYVVNTKWETDGFLHTKIAMNPNKYRKIELHAFSTDQPEPAPAFWLTCYQTCNKLDLNQYIPADYVLIEKVTARGMQSLLVSKQAHEKSTPLKAL